MREAPAGRIPLKRAALLSFWLCALTLISYSFDSAAANAPDATRLGVLVQEMGRPQSRAIRGLTDELRGLGYRERQHFVLETRNVKGNRAALQPAAGELVGRQVKLIFTTGTSATRAALAATSQIPVLFVHPGDPVAAGLMKNPEERGRNVTGVAAYAPQTTERRLELFKQILPSLRKIWVFFDANNSNSRGYFTMAESGAKKFGIEAVAYPIKSADELKTTLASLQPQNGSAIFQIADDLFEGETEYLFEVTRTKKIPTMFNEESWAIAGAFAAYGPSYLGMGRQAGRLADRLIRGENAAALPVERASKFDLILNYRTASFIGAPFSAESLKKADRVIR